MPFHSRTSRMPGWTGLVLVFAAATWSSLRMVSREKPPNALAWISQARASRSSFGLIRGSGDLVSARHSSRRSAGDRVSSRARRSLDVRGHYAAAVMR